MNNQVIIGQFKSSFSTSIIGKIEMPVTDLRSIELRGRKVLNDADFFLSEPSIGNSIIAPSLLPIQFSCILVFRDSSLKEILLFLKIDELRHPRERVGRTGV